ncbi:MAG TPA: hypothetical protein H9744_02995 [Candidatus Eisenbergiella stercoravium]|nr:hypothetical protein [Candidatus Eisenbergiella stercoravium]
MIWHVVINDEKIPGEEGIAAPGIFGDSEDDWYVSEYKLYRGTFPGNDKESRDWKSAQELIFQSGFATLRHGGKNGKN